MIVSFLAAARAAGSAGRGKAEGMTTNLVPRAMLASVVRMQAARTRTATLGVALAPNWQVLMPGEASIMT